MLWQECCREKEGGGCPAHGSQDQPSHSCIITAAAGQAAHQGLEQQLHCKELEKLGLRDVLPEAVQYWFWLEAL